MAVHGVLAKFVCSLESFSFWAREKKGVHFGAHRSRVSVHASHEAPTGRSPSLTVANLIREVEVIKVVWCESELGADFSSSVLPRNPPIRPRWTKEGLFFSPAFSLYTNVKLSHGFCMRLAG